jgi:hypothetical protein
MNAIIFAGDSACTTPAKWNFFAMELRNDAMIAGLAAAGGAAIVRASSAEGVGLSSHEIITEFPVKANTRFHASSSCRDGL